MLKLPSGFSNQPSNDGLTLCPTACGSGASSLVSWAGVRPATGRHTATTSPADNSPTAARRNLRFLAIACLLCPILSGDCTPARRDD